MSKHPKKRAHSHVGLTAETARAYENFKSLKDVPTQAFREIEEFFVNYHRLQGKKYRLLGCGSQRAAEKPIKTARKKA